MARKTQPVVIQEGELEGFNLDEYVSGIVEGIHDALGPADLRTAGCALDVAVSEFLVIVDHAEGPAAAQHYASLFKQSVDPFLEPARLPSYAELRRIGVDKKK